MSSANQHIRTIVLKVNNSKPEPDKMKIAAKAIKDACLVAFPTETVYGLGADALCSEAVSRIFRVKNRPLDNPIIVHVSSKNDVGKLVMEVPSIGRMLMDHLWPGPLTLIFKKKTDVPDITTGGLDTVGIRMPSHPVAHMLISMAETPIAAPSSNLSGSPSHTTPKHVIDDLFGKVDVIIDGGDTDIGVESTVLDILHKPPVLLRP